MQEKRIHDKVEYLLGIWGPRALEQASKSLARAEQQGKADDVAFARAVCGEIQRRAA
jgi:hypothetical protein